MDWRDNLPYTHRDFRARHRARCFCGAVAFETRADPVDAKFCHCPACQALHGAPLQWAVIFHKRDVRFTRGLEQLRFFNSDLGTRAYRLPCKLSCRACGAPLADDGRRMFLAFGPLFDFGSPPVVPDSFRPSCHIFYGNRVVDIADDLPKYEGHKGTSPRLDREGRGG